MNRKITVKRLLINIFFMVMSIITTLIIIELTFKIIVSSSAGKNNYISRWEFRAKRPLPYKNADYYNTQFLNESLQCVRDIRKPLGEQFILQGDVSGNYFNVINNIRKTTGQPKRYNNKILMFGGSTLFCQEVPDAYTVSSYLQELINTRQHGRFLVVNYGTVSMIAKQQAARLKTVPISPGDIVIFYDGINDVYYPIYNGNHNGWLPGDAHDGGNKVKGVKQLSNADKMLYPLLMRYSKYSSLCKYLLRNYEKLAPANIQNTIQFDTNLISAMNGYCKALLYAHTYAKNNGAVFYHFLQPNIFTHDHLSAYEKKLITNELKAYPDLDKAFIAGYVYLRKGLSSASRAGVSSADLTRAFAVREHGDEFYLDLFHVNHNANKIIAENIYKNIFKDR